MFKNSRGYKLSAKLILPEPKGLFPLVIFSHGFDSSKNSPRSLPVAKSLSSIGIASFLFDYTGHGQSEGQKEESTILQQTDDLKNALDFIESLPTIDKNRIGLHGSSSGSLVIINLSLTDRRAKTAVLRAPRTNHFVSGVKEAAKQMKLPILFIQGGNDPLLDETKVFYHFLENESRLVVIPGADHLFSAPEKLEEVVKITTSWFNQKLKMKKAA